MNIYFGPIVGRSYEPDFIHCAINLMRLRPMKFKPVCNDALVSRSRSIVGSQFLKSGDDVLLMIDTDIVFKPEDALRLCDTAHATQQIVVGLYSCRSDRQKKCASLLKRGQMVDSLDPTPVEIEYGATGFMAVPRAVFEVLEEDPELPMCHGEVDWAFQPFFMPFVAPLDDRLIYLSEDYAFCDRAKRYGFKILAIPDIKLLHIGGYAYTLADSPFLLTRLDEVGVQYRLETAELAGVGR